MSISFTNEDLKTISKIILFTPIEIASLEDQKSKVLVGQADMQKKDEANKVFYDNYKGILKAYYDERKALDGLTYTEYQDSQLDNSAKLREGNVHYPVDPVWFNFSPKVVGTNTGLPISNQSVYEINKLPNLTVAISQLKTGFTDGSTTTTLRSAYSGGTTVSVNGGTFAVGQRVVVHGGGFSALLKVVLITNVPASPGPPPVPSSVNLTVQVLAATDGTIPTGSTVRNFFEGFPNTEREGSPTLYDEILFYYRSILDSEVGIWKTYVNSQKNALDNNDAVGAEASEVSTAKTNVQNTLDVIQTWESNPVVGVGVSRFGNTKLSPLESKITERTSQAPARVSQIVTALGSLTQSGDGAFDGSGNWFKFFQWIDFRISKSSGTLFSYYNFDLIVKFVEDKTQKAIDKKAEYDQYMIVKKITKAPDGTNVIELENVSGLSNGNSVQIMDDTELAITNATISGISGQLVTLSVPISGYALDKFARLVKIL
jgi:hypothetical protein